VIRKHWISCVRFTVQVNTEDGVIVLAAPIVRKFIGQRLENLLGWCARLGGLKHELLEED